jgi:DNA repair photolyase
MKNETDPKCNRNSINLDAYTDGDADILIQNVNPKFQPIFEKINYSIEEKRAIYKYLFSRKPKKLPPSMRNRIIGLYDSPADRSKRFRDGLRWCINIYVGCQHNCGYCYVNVYSQDNVGIAPHAKAGFETKLKKDIQEIKSFGIPAVPLHMSNSTDPLQEALELHHRHTLLTLQMIAEYRELFTSVVLLTKNPKILIDERYLSIITDPGTRPFTVQITCAFWRDEIRSFYEPNAPTVSDRLKTLKFLASKGVDVELRIDPLFPSSRIEESTRKHKAFPYYGIPEAQTKEDIISLIRYAKNEGAKAIIAKPLKVPISKRAQQCKNWFGIIYQDANAPNKRRVRGGSWRLPDNYQKMLFSTVSDACEDEGIKIKHCLHDVLTRN